MQPIYAILASGIWLFLSGALVFAVLLPKWFKANFAQITRDEKDIPLWAVALEKLLQSLGLKVNYCHDSSGTNPGPSIDLRASLILSTYQDKK